MLALDSRLDVLGRDVSRLWDPSWPDQPNEQVIGNFVPSNPQVIVIGPGVEESAAVAWIGALERHRPDIAVVLVAEADDELLLHALRCGVADVLTPGISLADLQAALERAHEVAARRDVGGAVAAGSADANRMIAVVSPKGGTGKTMIAAALAMALADPSVDGDVGLLDLDVQFGCLASVLGMLPEHGLGEAAAAARSGLDATTIKVFLTKHQAGLYVLTAPSSLVEAEEIEAEHIKAVLHHFSELFRWSVIDTAGGIAESLLVALEYATDVVMVTTPEVAAVRSLRRWIEGLELVGLLRGERHLIVNQFDARTSLALDEIEAIIGMAVSGTIPPSRAIFDAMEAGQGLAELPPRDRAAAALEDLLGVFVPRPTAANNGGWFRKKGR